MMVARDLDDITPKEARRRAAALLAEAQTITDRLREILRELEASNPR